MQLLPTCVCIWCTACGGKQPPCHRRSDLLKALLSESTMATTRTLTVSSTVYVYTCEPVHVCVCVHACMCAIRCVLRVLKCLPLSVIPLSAATCSAHTPNPDRSKHCTPSNPVKSLFTDDLVWRQQAAGVGDRKGGKERRREGRRGEGWERLRRWSYQGVAHCRGLLLWAIVKELGGIIGLLCPMWSMHF